MHNKNKDSVKNRDWKPHIYYFIDNINKYDWNKYDWRLYISSLMNNADNCDWESDVLCFTDSVNSGIKKYKLYDSADCIDIIGIRYLIADLLKWKCRYVVDDRRWYWYSEGYWKPDDFDIKIKEYIKIISDDLLALYNFEFIKARMSNALEPIEKTIQKLSESEETKIFLEWKAIGLVLRESKTRDKIIKEMSSIYPIYLKDFNTSPHLLNCTNCTIDLVKKEIIGHDSQLLLINTTNVEYDESAKCEIWESFISEIMQNNEENIRFLQKIVGYFLTGDMSYERFFIFQGKTNHKTIFIETIFKMLGNYVVTFEPEILSMKNNSNVGSQLSRLTSVRFVNVNEIPKEMELNSSLINRIISGSTITIKDKYKNIVEIKPQCKIGLTTNFLPKITDENIFEGKKINKLKLCGNGQSKELINSFQEPENLSGILNWALNGLDLLNIEGLRFPENVVDDINEYRGNVDIIGEFIKSCFIKTDESYKERSSQVYEQYKFWCRHNEFYYDYPQKFWAEMITRVRRTRSNKGYVIWGYKLISNYSWNNPLGDDYNISEKLKVINNNSSIEAGNTNRGITKIESLKIRLLNEEVSRNNNEQSDMYRGIQVSKETAVIDEIMSQAEKDLHNEIIDNVQSDKIILPSPDECALTENFDSEDAVELLDPFNPIDLNEL